MKKKQREEALMFVTEWLDKHRSPKFYEEVTQEDLYHFIAIMTDVAVAYAEHVIEQGNTMSRRGYE